METNIYPNLGNNIKALREAFGKSLDQMADDLETAGNTNKRFEENYRFITKQAISNYENGTRIPKREQLNAIAKYFKVTVDELLYSDFSNLKFDMGALNNKDLNIKYLNILFPIISNDEALKNDKFKKAYELHKKVFNYFTGEENDFQDNDIEDLRNMYELAYKDDNNIEAIYNLLSWIMFENFLTSVLTPSNIDKFEIKNNISPFEFLEMIFLEKPELEIEDVEKNNQFKKELKEYLEKEDLIFYKCIRILKKKGKYTEFADFYLALRYLLGLFSDNSFETERMIGTSLLNSLDYIGNSYVKKFKNINK